MRLWIFSDWHLERGGRADDILAGGIPDADVCVVPGDLDVGPRALSFLGAAISTNMPVVCTPGNHCFRGRHYERTRSEMAAIAAGYRRLHLLDPGTVVIDGVRFVGATLWTDFALAGVDRVGEGIECARPRFRSILTGSPDEERLWSPEDARARHLEEVGYLDRVLATPHSGRTVVVSHHAPHPGSMHPRFRSQDMVRSAGYVSDLNALILRRQPDIWVHGHVHNSADHVVGATRILANPRGYEIRSVASGGTERVEYPQDVVVRPAGHDRDEIYSGPENHEFKPDLVIDLPG